MVRANGDAAADLALAFALLEGEGAAVESQSAAPLLGIAPAARRSCGM